MLEWAGTTFVKFTKIRAWQELLFVLAAISKIERHEKALNFSYSDGLLTTYERICFVVCIYSDYTINFSCFIEQVITLFSVLITFDVFCN